MTIPLATHEICNQQIYQIVNHSVFKCNGITVLVFILYSGWSVGCNFSKSSFTRAPMNGWPLKLVFLSFLYVFSFFFLYRSNASSRSFLCLSFSYRENNKTNLILKQEEFPNAARNSQILLNVTQYCNHLQTFCSNMFTLVCNQNFSIYQNMNFAIRNAFGHKIGLIQAG